MGRPLKIAKAQAVVTITATDGTTEVVTTSANFTNLGIIAGMPFIPASTVGGLTGGVMYWILEVLNAGNNSTFTVSATPLNANPTYAKVNLTTTTSQTVAATVAPVDAYFNNPNGGAGYPATNANTYSVVGGNTAIYGTQVLCRVAIAQNGVGTITVDTGSPNITGVGTDFANTLADGMAVATTDGVFLGIVDDIANANATFATFAANSEANVTNSQFEFAQNEAGFIVRQKGKQKYLVQGTSSGLIGACYTANLANAALYPGTMNIVGTYANAATVNVQSLSDHTAELFTSTSGITADPNNTANINNTSPAFATFNTAYAANTYGGQPYPIVTINGA
jgi:hypothetical protein